MQLDYYMSSHIETLEENFTTCVRLLVPQTGRQVLYIGNEKLVI